MARLRPKPNSSPDDLAFGINAVAMALTTGSLRSLLYLAGVANPRVRELVGRAEEDGVRVEAITAERLDELTGGGVHQGVAARLKPLPTVALTRLGEVAGPAASLVVLLDGVTDPQNLGAVLRTAVAVSAQAVVLPRRRGAQLTPGVHRASAGTSFLAPVAAPQNLAQALRSLKALGYWGVAAEAGGAADALSFDWPKKTALIMGSEAQGVARLLRDEADFAVSLPMNPSVESLNVGVAFGVLAYLWRRQWPEAA